MADTNTDIKEIFNKKPNEDAQTEIEEDEVPEDEYLTADQWNQVGDYIQATQAELTDLKTGGKKYVRGIRQNNQIYSPDDDNIVTLPGADTTVSLYTDLDESKPYIVTAETIYLNLRAVSVQGGSATYETVNVEVYTAAIGSTDFARKGNFSLRAKGPSSQEYDAVDFTSYLDTGKQQVQLIATGARTGVSGTLLFSSITRTTLDIELNMAWQSPIIISSGQSSQQFDFHFSGSVERKFHLNIYGTQCYQTGGATTTLNQNSTFSVVLDVPAGSYTSFNENYSYQYVDSTSYGVLNHGVHTLEAWITCDNGYGETLSSKVIRQQVMIVNGQTTGVDLYSSYLLLQNVTRSVTNYVTIQKFCEYAYWKPSTSDYTKASTETDTLSFLITDYGSSTSTYNTEYSRQTTTVLSNTQYTLAETIEIETEASTTNGYFRVYNDDTNVNILEPTNPYQIDLSMTSYISIDVDNSERFIPTTGAAFILNPKNRNNTEDDPARIINAAKGSSESGYIVPATFKDFSFIDNNDGWVTSSDDSQKVLRLLAGQKLTIDYDTFDAFASSAASDLTIELDFKVRNVTNEDEQIFGINETPTGSDHILGICLKPLDGYGMSNSASVEISQDFHWMEDVRTRLTFNILQSVTTKIGDDSSKVALFRCFVDGVINREFIWKKELGEWYSNGSQIVIGQDHADIDIYSLRIYKKALNASEVLNDYISTLPTLTEKIAIRDANDIFGDDGLISRTLIENNIKGNTLTYHATRLPDYNNQGNSLGWVEIKRYDTAGNYLPRKSGTICKSSKKITFKGQGATAKTYYYWNVHYKVDDVTDTITIPLSQLDEETFGTPEVWTDEATGKHYITIPEWQGNVDGDWEVTYVDDTPYVTILDGWIDGDNNYRGQGYESGEGWFENGEYKHDIIPLGKKLCDKINYASSMQNHKIGGISAYNDLHKAIVGENTLQQHFEGARVACIQDDYYRFMQTSDAATPVFDGIDTYGAAKVDKPTWGYHKSVNPYFCVIEGADNSLPLTDFRVPFDDDVVQHIVAGSDEIDGWSYAGLVSWNYDQGDTYKIDGIKYPLPEIEANVKTFCNFLYTHAPTIKVYVGTKAAFLEESTQTGTTIDQSYKYWCTSGDDQYRLLRYNFLTTSWVDAGTWDMDTMTYTGGVCQLNTIYPDLFSKYSGQWDVLNTAIIAAIVAEAKTKIESNTFIKANSLKLHYAYVNQFEAGTDNNSKNTYFAYDDQWPTYVDDEGVQHYGIWELHVDDIDTLKKTDNSGRQLKPYYIRRNFDVDFKGIDPTTLKPIYEDANNYVGKGNVIFNLCNEMWEATGENRSMTARMFNEMSTLVSTYNQKHNTSYSESPWGFEQLYFFRHTKYFCQSAFNETARIRYEYPAAIDFHSERGVYPMTQSLGDQLQTEQEYVKRRLIMFASYAQWGEFATEGSSSTTGISDVALRFGCQLDATIVKPSRAEFKLSVIPHQFMVPCGRCGESNKYYGEMVAPGEQVIFDITQGSQADDTAVSLCAANYFTSFGNLGDTPVRRSEQFGIQGSRLTDVTAVPTITPARFNPIGISVSSTPLIETIDLEGCDEITGRLDLTNNIRLHKVKLKNTAITQIVLPKTPTLTNLELPETLTSLDIENLTNLDPTTGFDIQGVDKLVDITIVQSADIVAHSFYTRLAEALES